VLEALGYLTVFHSYFKSFSIRSTGALLLVCIFAGITIGESVSAAPSTKATWKVSSLGASQVVKLSAVVATNSAGVKTWSKTGTCTLTPKRKPTKLIMGATGSCKLTLKVAKSKKYLAKTFKKTIALAAPATTTVVTSPAAPTTTIALTCATGGTCVVGNTGPGGGTVFYVASSAFTSTGSVCNTACKYLEAAPVGWITSTTPESQVNCSTPGTISTDPKCEWSGNTISAIGTTGTGIGTGYANTSAMIAQSNTAGKAGTVARAFRGGGKADWYLPSIDETHQMYVQKTTIGLTADYCWSSSEYEAIGARLQYIATDYETSVQKSFIACVRPVRAF
jgi:hypothetical protein